MNMVALHLAQEGFFFTRGNLPPGNPKGPTQHTFLPQVGPRRTRPSDHHYALVGNWVGNGKTPR